MTYLFVACLSAHISLLGEKNATSVTCNQYMKPMTAHNSTMGTWRREFIARSNVLIRSHVATLWNVEIYVDLKLIVLRFLDMFRSKGLVLR